ncbi:cellulose biosynthesis cyclic di-GMP-binding regulatory protein BcsB, partial [Rhizobiaceae sp. 2RAB30]
PFRTLTLAGETDRRSWSIHLTAEQAAAPATLHFAYKNAIVVAPEISQLNIAINGVGLADGAIRSSEEFTDVTVGIPPGLLKPGANTFSMQASMRHRTDCSIQSTYELWTELDPAGTYISFASADAGRLRRMEDVAAIGFDSFGTTRLSFVVPAMDLAATTGPVMRLAQGLAMIANMPNQQIDIAQSDSGDVAPGRLKVMVGTPAELQALSVAVPQGAAISPVASFVEDSTTASPTLVISGPTWPALETAIETIVAPVDRPPSQLRT